MHSIKYKIIALVLCSIILSAVAVGGASILNSKRVLEGDSSKIINLLCETRANEVTALFDRVEQSVRTLTVYAQHQVTDFGAFQSSAEYVQQYTESLRDVAINSAMNTEGAVTVYIRYNPAFTNSQSGLFCAKNAYRNTFENLPPTDLSLYEASDIEHVGWFYLPVQQKKGTWLAPYFNQNIQMEMISYAVPFYVDNILVGVVGMDIDFRILQNAVAKTNVYESGYAFLTDEQANIVYHKELSSGTDLYHFNNGEFSDLVEVMRSSESSDGSLFSYSYEGSSKKAAFRSLSNGMRFVLAVPSEEIDTKARELALQIIIAVFVIVLAAAMFTLLFARKLIRPLLELTEAAKKIAEGDLSVSITHKSKDEVGVLAESFRQTVAHLHKYISYINELAYRDSLTGVKNKTAYLEITKRMDDLMRLKRPQYAVIVFDINGLKVVNDSRGHDFGDILIINACRIICRVFKRSPVYRIGGDEFVVLLENADFEIYPELLSRFKEEIIAYNRNPQDDLTISVACGIAVFSEETDLTYGDVFKRADGAMYHNKAEMKNRPDTKMPAP